MSMEKFAKILGIDLSFLSHIGAVMAERTQKTGVMEKIAEDNEAIARHVLKELGLDDNASAPEVRRALQTTVRLHERQLLAYLGTIPGKNEFERAASLAGRVVGARKGFFLKKTYGEEILRKSKPERLLDFLGYKSIEELLEKHDVTEVFSALRFIESDEWMHETFEKAYGNFTAEDFEERNIEIKVLGSEWREVAAQFVAKKHHNVSHLKEFGVIFLNPIREDVPGKFVRDFALLLHYFHEIEFYSKLFTRSAASNDFAARLKSLLRGDVKEATAVQDGEWLIVQRYLWKINPRDPRLFLPRVNPESMHWSRGERDLARLGKNEKDLKVRFWGDLDWIGSIFRDGEGEVVSFDLEDNAMTEVSAIERKNEFFNYHHREALWTRIFSEYAGGETEMERLLLENFYKGVIMF